MVDNRKIEGNVKLLKASLERELSEQEQKDLDRWLNLSEKNREVYKRLHDNHLLLEKLSFYESSDTEADWQQVLQKIRRNKTRLWLRWMSYAAVFTGLLFAVGLFYVYNKNVVIQVADFQVQDTISPGFRQAYIEFGTGEKVVLGERGGGFVKKIGQGVMRENEEGLVMEFVDSLQTKAVKNEYGKVVVPCGGEYQLLLADGTQVWLNSDSKLEFPLVFTGTERRVKLCGEAYFKVQPNKNMPFRIEVGDSEICVLGTSFNVNYYENHMRTTLVEGAVSVATCGHNYFLSPGEEATVSAGKVEIEKVDVYERIAWTEGKFVFRDRRLEEVMDILKRWYDVEVFYQKEEVKDLHFTGNIPRHATIGEVLRFLERTRLVHFNISERTVIVGGMRK